MPAGSTWPRANFRGGADIEVTLRGEPRPMRAVLDEDPATVAAAYAKLLADLGHRKANRLGITVTVDRQPTLEELRDAVERHGLSIVALEQIEPVGAGPAAGSSETS